MDSVALALAFTPIESTMTLLDRPAPRRLLPLLLGLVALLLPAPTSAQGMTGQVVDAASGVPLAEVRITVLDETSREHAVTVSDSSGQFVLPLPAGRYTLHLERLGYRALTTPSLAVNRAETVILELRLGAEAIPLEPLVVTSRVRSPPLGSDAFYRRMRQYRDVGAGRFFTRAQIDSTSTTNVHTLLARDPAVRIRRGRFTEYVAFESRGRTCLPALYLDGVYIRNHSETDLSAWIQPGQIEGIEIYPNPALAPAELVRGGECGALAIWTRGSRGNPFTLKRGLIAGGIVALMLLITR